MRAGSRNVVQTWVIIMLWSALAGRLAWPQTSGAVGPAEKGAKGPVQTWTRLAVDLPTSQTLFPAGNGADIANGQCLICHSAGMVLRQPPFTEDEWRREVNKMRNAFGAPLPADQVDVLVRYLYTIDGSRAPTDRAVLDGQGS